MEARTENSILSSGSAAPEIHTDGLRQDLCVFMYFQAVYLFSGSRVRGAFMETARRGPVGGATARHHI